MDETSLLAPLPDDVVLAVLACLSPREVLRCRLVCRRLRDLCLHPDLWRHVRLDGRDFGLVCAALRLAPRLRDVTLGPRRVTELAPMLPYINCVLAKLFLCVTCQLSVNAAEALLQKFCALGGLKHIGMSLVNEPTQDLLPPLRVVLTARHLRELDIVITRDTRLPAPAAWSDLEVTASLTKLSIFSFVDDASLSLLQFLLTTHAATLKNVFVCHIPKGLPVPALMNLPRLRSLSCSIMSLPPDPQLSRNLQELHLQGITPDVFPSEALDVLRQAPNLRSVILPVPRDNPSAPLLALTQSRSARALERLRLRGASNLVQLAAVLPLFPSLQRLDLDVQASDAFLRAVSPASAPSLTSLRVKRPQGACLHDWLHQPEIVGVLARNPRLHLHQFWLCVCEDRNEGCECYWKSSCLQDRAIGHLVLGKGAPLQPRRCSVPVGCECHWCRRGCHAEVMQRASLESAFALHQKKPDCVRGCTQLHLNPPPARLEAADPL